jgi:hypothetical protein
MLTIDEVVDEQSLIEYAHMVLGTPYPTQKQIPTLRKTLKQFFKDYPDANYRCLTDVVVWARARHKHLDMVRLFGSYRYAYQDGYMRILERGGRSNDDETLGKLLVNVTDPKVRERMAAAATAAARDEIYEHYISLPDVTSEKSSRNLRQGLTEGQVVRYRLSLADPLKYGTIVGSRESKVLVHGSGQDLEMAPHMIYVRKDGEWHEYSD